VVFHNNFQFKARDFLHISNNFIKKTEKLVSLIKTT